ncbi:MAG TPA: sodium transporter, partial [Puia sp.]|nr:sodium transporter [Puia sp.]
QKYTGFISPGVFAMFILGMFWKRTTGAAAVAGVITGLALCYFFNEKAPGVFGHETWLYTAYPNGHGGYEIPFLICMGLSFFFTVAIMVAISLAGPKINPKAFELDKTMFKLKPQATALIVIILLLLAALYIKFW